MRHSTTMGRSLRPLRPDWSPGVGRSAARHGVAPNQLFTWRRLVAQGRLTAGKSAGFAKSPILLAFRQLCALAPPAAAVMVTVALTASGLGKVHRVVSLWNY